MLIDFTLTEILIVPSNVVMTCNVYINADVVYLPLRWFRHLNACLFILNGSVKVERTPLSSLLNQIYVSFKMIKADGFLCSWWRSHNSFIVKRMLATALKHPLFLSFFLFILILEYSVRPSGHIFTVKAKHVHTLWKIA